MSKKQSFLTCLTLKLEQLKQKLNGENADGKKYFKYFFILLFIVPIILCGFFLWQIIYLPIMPSSEKQVVFIIEKGEGSKEIAHGLQGAGLINWASVLRGYVLLINVAEKLQAGEYLLSPNMSLHQMVNKFISGDTIKRNITIIEGWNLRNIGDYLENEGISDKEKFFAAVGQPLNILSEESILILSNISQEFSFLKDKPKNLGLEGYLFPDTYEIQKSESREELVAKILKNFDQKLTSELRTEIVRQGKIIFEVITMASLLEKEVKTLEDKKIVSGILWKRLENKMPLQVDATISYITGKNTTKILLADLQIDSPYNTYKYKGLPLGPICNPGLESIIAAVYPENSPYWYYLSTPEGKTIFSQTLEEHKLAKAKYLQ